MPSYVALAQFTSLNDLMPPSPTTLNALKWYTLGTLCLVLYGLLDGSGYVDELLTKAISTNQPSAFYTTFFSGIVLYGLLICGVIIIATVSVQRT